MQKKYFVRYIVTKMLEDFIKKEGGNISNHEISADDYFDLIYQLLINSKEIDAVVLLAMDGIYNNTGNHELLIKETELFASNRFVYKKVCELNDRITNSTDGNIKKKKFYFGASVSPNRLDWEAELKYVCEDTEAVLLKWIPSAMHIQVWDKGHENFYKTLVKYNLPLLCHVGPEYAFIEGVSKASYDNFKYLDTPLNYGVKVIAAHCATPLLPVDRNDLDDFIRYLNFWNANEIKLWADTSALNTTTRMSLLPKIINNINSNYLVHGSDFPVPISGVEHLPYITHDMTLSEYQEILVTKNPFDLDVKLKRAHGFNDDILKNAENVLRLPKRRWFM